MIFILIWLPGCVVNYFFVRWFFREAFGSYTKKDRVFNIMFSLLSWLMMVITAALCPSYLNGEEEASW